MPPKGRGADAFEPEGFKTFWETWPKSDRKGGKAKCLEVWRSQRLEGEASSVIAHVAHMASTDAWRKNGGEFIPGPLVYLNQRRWDGAETGGKTGLQLVGAL